MPKKPLHIFHLIPNAHLDPVWLWDWREGHEEAVSTCRTILDLMDEDDEVTFTRGEASIYAYLAEHDPATFKRILKRIRQGRWEVVGGTWVQADTNLPTIETFTRLYSEGQAELQRLTGRRATIAWAADSFGHAAGLPEVMVNAGIDGFACTRPGNGQLPLAKPAFWWEAPSGARVLAYRPSTGWYGCERSEMAGRLDALLTDAQGHGLRNVGVFFGLGNHGGGPTRKHLADLRTWAAQHPEIELRWDGLRGLIDGVRAEAKRQADDWLPVHRGDLGHCLRGCYASNLRFKSSFRRAESDLVRAEATDAAIGAALERDPAVLTDAWRGLLFNTFHDILPGSSIERAYDQQLDQLGGVRHAAATVEHAAVATLARNLAITVPEVPADHPKAQPVLVWNPVPRASERIVELEASLDWRPIWAYTNHPQEVPLVLRGPDGRALPFQRIETEHRAMPGLPWRFRVLTKLGVPGLGWSVADLGWVEGAEAPAWKGQAATADGAHAITCGGWRVEAKPGDSGVTILRDGAPFLAGAGLQARLDDDRFGSWGGMGEEPESFNAPAEPREHWTITAVTVRESGPLRAALWVRLAGTRSRLDLEFRLESGRDAVDVRARANLDDRSARLRLVVPTGSDQAEYATPGATLVRGAMGEVPGGRWVRCGRVGFTSDALYAFQTRDGALLPTVARTTRFADDRVMGPDEEPWRPVQDTGESRFAFVLAPATADLGHLAEELAQPLQTVPVSTRDGKLPRVGGMLDVSPSSVRLLALQATGKGVVLRLHNEGATVKPRVTWQGKPITLGTLPAGAIRSWRLGRNGAKPVDPAKR